MESPAMILYLLAAIAGLAALELRQAKMTVIAVGAAFLLVAVAMFMLGAVEVGVGAIIGGLVVAVVLRWGFVKTSEGDALPSVHGGATGALAIAGVVLFAVVLFVAVRPFFADGAAVADAHAGIQVGLLREALVIVAALGAVWAMLRKSGRRDE